MRFKWMAAALLAAAPALALAETYPGTEYVSGRTGLASKIKGSLAIEESEIRFQDKNGAAVFTIPIADVVEAKDSREHDEGSFGRKMVLGIFAGKTEEFLTVNVQGANSAEAVVFKCKKKTAPGMAAKVNFYAQKARSDSASR